jgi:TorA maturation chaperone TorD
MTLEAEDQARADFYALLARLFYGPPDRALLGALAASPPLAAEDKSSPLAKAWEELRAAAASADPEAVREEYESVFVGTGKAEVTLYGSAYTVRSAVDNPLVELREFLWQQGMARNPGASEPEDHVAGLCDAMRFLIAEKSGIGDVEKLFFKKFIWPSAMALCDAITRHEGTAFYRRVGCFAQSFFELEHAALDMQ